MSWSCTLLAAMIACAAACADATAEVSGWRGDGSGIYATATPPTRWSATENVRWVTRLPGGSPSSPAVIAGHVFCCSAPDILTCLDSDSGAVAWSRPNPLAAIAPADTVAKIAAAATVGVRLRWQWMGLRSQRDAAAQQSRQHPEDSAARAQLERIEQKFQEIGDQLAPYRPYLTEIYPSIGPAFPTPVSDGHHVYAAFGTGVVVAYATDGTLLWRRYLETPHLHWGQTSSPLLVDGRLLIHFNDLFALDPETGATVWQYAARPSHGTARICVVGGATVAVLPYGDVVRVQDGHVMAAASDRTGWWMWFPSPVVRDGVAFFIDGIRREALRLRPGADGGLVEVPLWRYPTPPHQDSWLCSAVACDGRLCVLSNTARFLAIDAASGKIVCDRSLASEQGKVLAHGNDCVAPLTLAGHYLYANLDHDAIHVLDVEHEYAEVARNTLEPCRSAPVFVGSRMYLRTWSSLYCISDDAGPAKTGVAAPKQDPMPRQ